MPEEAECGIRRTAPREPSTRRLTGTATCTGEEDPTLESTFADSLLHATLEATADGILVIDLEGHVVGRNSRFLRMWQVPDPLHASGDGECLLRHMCSLVVDVDDLLAQVAQLTSEPERQGRGETRMLDGRVIERFSLPQRMDGRVIGRVWSFRDVTAERRLRADLERAAYTDTVSGIGNRAKFLHDIYTVLQEPGEGFSVCVLDLDGFKFVNDSHGHRAGDIVLRELAQRLRALVRDGGSVARLGGDEFGLIVPTIEDTRMQAICEQAVVRCSEPVVLAPGTTAQVSASAGWTTLLVPTGHPAEPQPGQPDREAATDPQLFAFHPDDLSGTYDSRMHWREVADRLLHEADLAMYSAKDGGRRCVRRFTAGQQRLPV